MWTEGPTAPRNIAVQVADVHKPLLSLGRCAVAEYESRFGQTAGWLIDCENGDVIPLHRRGNLYFVKAWVRSSPNAEMHFCGSRRRKGLDAKPCKTSNV